jgi:hypothetical protein
MMGDLNSRIGNTKITKIVGTNGEPTVNNNGKKLIDFCTLNNMRIMNSFFKHRDIHEFTWPARGSKSVIDYSIANEKAEKLFKDVRVYRGAELGTDHFLLCAKLRFPPGWKNNKSCNKSNKKLPQSRYKTRLLNDNSKKWLYQRRIDEFLKQFEESQI